MERTRRGTREEEARREAERHAEEPRELEHGYPLGGYPHGFHWHHDPERPAPSIEPRRWPEGVHAPWEDRAWWDQQRHPGERSEHPEHRFRDGFRRLLHRGPHVGKGPKGYRRSDERIREDVCERFATAGWVDVSDVEVHVADAEVTLTGTVGSRSDKRLLAEWVEDVPGVRDVHNRLRVRHQ